ncbi:Histone-lysine N-methyltransferase 2B [Dissophora globulifera]|uniref:Histone-lysine N-methyltransferase 2B n=1 Tax=Dissophora globulifera TaxID=979702 RepID=A0A9P6UVM2_9FUNG|nr:Histone-lysine N-methyltransferase 2B [Dissophora globulifera]
MQAPEMQADESANGTNRFALSNHYRHSSQEAVSFSKHAAECDAASAQKAIEKDESESPLARSLADSESADARSSGLDAPPKDDFAREKNDHSASLPSNIMNWHGGGSSVSGESKATTPTSYYGPYRSVSDADEKTHKKLLPPRLLGHGRMRPDDFNLTALSPTSYYTTPSPLASPITATANSLTALSISQSSTHAAFSGRDLSKVIIPRERKQTRPYSIASMDTLLAQERKRGGQDNDSNQDQSGRMSDPETSRRQEHESTKARTRVDPKAEVGSPTPTPTLTSTPASTQTSTHTPTPTSTLSTPSAMSNSSKSTDMKSPSLKPAAQLRVNLYNLVSTGYLPANTLAIFREHSAIVTAKGTLIPQYKDTDTIELHPWLQNEYETPSAWATAMVKGGRTGKVAVNGWSAIKIPIQQVPELSKMFEGQGLTDVSLDVLRKRYLADMTEDGAQPDSSSTQSGKGSAALDRKKRKRHGPASANATGLQITTPTETTGPKGRSSTTRPRKRTVSDLSGMVTSDIMGNRQLHLEAAGALFSMQDSFSSPTQTQHIRHSTTATNSSGSRQKLHGHKHSIILESLAQYRHERESAWSSYSSGNRMSALRIVKTLSMASPAVPLGLGLSKEDVEFCVLCGAAGETTGPRRPVATLGTAHNHTITHGGGDATIDMVVVNRSVQNTMKRCIDCGDCYHLDCVQVEVRDNHRVSSSSEEEPRCPRCTVCKCCQGSIFGVPALSRLHSEASSEQVVTAATAMTAMEASEGIQVLSCDRCRRFSHLSCQLIREPTLKDSLQTHTKRNILEWICLDCRECVECGNRALASAVGVVTASADIDMAVEGLDSSPGSQDRGGSEGRWSNGYALCPSCTVLAEKGNICPLCCRIYQDDDYETPMIFCDGCSLWVHVACDKGLQDRDYEELGEDSKQYFCPSCIPTPIPSPTHSSSSSSVFSAVNSVEQSPWQGSHGYGHPRTESLSNDHSREVFPGNEEDWQFHHGSGSGRRRKDDIMDLIKAAQEISDSESRATSPYSNYNSPMFPSSTTMSASSSISSHSRTLSASLESVAEVAAAEALLTIFSSGTSTPVSSTPYTSYPPSPFEPSLSGMYDRRYYSVMNSSQSAAEQPPLMQSMMVFTPPSSSSDMEPTSTPSVTQMLALGPAQMQECQGVSSCRCQRHRDIAHIEDYFNSRPYPRRRSVSVTVTATVPYHQIGQELNVLDKSRQQEEKQNIQMSSVEVIDIDMEDSVAETLAPGLLMPSLLPAKAAAHSKVEVVANQI